MRRFIILAMAAILAACSASPVLADSWTGPDKAKHLQVSAAIAGAGVVLGLTERQSFAASLAVGLAKELHDARPGGSGFSTKDLAADALGAYLGAKLGGLTIRRDFVGYTWRL